MTKRVLAFDFGASSGRAIIGCFDGDKITLEEVHRFSNDPVSVGGTVYWDVLRLFYEIKQGIVKAKIAGGFDSIGIDTWGVDFGLIDSEGKLMENPVHYRDARTVGLVDEAFKTMPKEKLYGITGIQFMELNTLFQLISLKKYRPWMLERADKMLFMPDLLAYMLTGKMCAEYSIASTSQLIDLETKSWSEEILDAFGIKKSLFAPLVKPGTVLGELSKEICEECGVDPVPVISVCGHDTQSAITSVPCEDGNFAFLSSGTWSLFGTELDKPIVNETSMNINITNEGGFDGSTGFLKNIIGLWLIQESRRQWKREGEEYSYADLEKLALAAEPFKCFIDPDAPEFVPHGNIPERVREFCRRTGQHVPQTVGEVMRCIYESLAMKYRLTFEKLRECTKRDYPVIHVIGGGTKDGLLCQMTANSCDRTVKAGPIEATVMGNVAVQLMSDGSVENIGQARKIVADSSELKTFEPKDTNKWAEAYKDFLKVT
ncbi:MAG: rhamnulokinase [Clostridiaceae bacterium]|nr:rhamnulokinase [Clostridiaceae bacterium]MDY5890099.1 rhamnulokinase family protein [Oscillospiraceae bacterium]